MTQLLLSRNIHNNVYLVIDIIPSKLILLLYCIPVPQNMFFLKNWSNIECLKIVAYLWIGGTDRTWFLKLKHIRHWVGTSPLSKWEIKTKILLNILHDVFMPRLPNQWVLQVFQDLAQIGGILAQYKKLTARRRGAKGLEFGSRFSQRYCDVVWLFILILKTSNL